MLLPVLFLFANWMLVGIPGPVSAIIIIVVIHSFLHIRVVVSTVFLHKLVANTINDIDQTLYSENYRLNFSSLLNVMGRKVHLMTSYQLLMTYLINGIQQWWKKLGETPWCSGQHTGLWHHSTWVWPSVRLLCSLWD